MELNNSKIKIKTKNLNVYYGAKQALFDINLDINQKEVTALIGPSGCGKSTFIRCINRMNDVIDICKVEGSIQLDGNEINEKKVDVVTLREKVGMVFQKPNPFPKSIYENIAYGPTIHGVAENKDKMEKTLPILNNEPGVGDILLIIKNCTIKVATPIKINTLPV